MLRRYHDRYDPERALIGIDLCPRMVEIASAKLDPIAMIVLGDMRNLETNLVRFKAKAQFYPTQEQGLQALVTAPTTGPKPKYWTQCLGEEALIDPWTNKYQYRSPGRHNTSGHDIYSLGPDKKDGTEDDIGNWQD